MGVSDFSGGSPLKEPVIRACNYCVTSIARAVSHRQPRQYVTTGIWKLRGQGDIMEEEKEY